MSTANRGYLQHQDRPNTLPALKKYNRRKGADALHDFIGQKRESKIHAITLKPLKKVSSVQFLFCYTKNCALCIIEYLTN